MLIHRLLTLTMTPPGPDGSRAPVAQASQKALIDIGYAEPVIFVNTAGSEAWRMGESDKYHSTAILSMASLFYY